MAPITVPQKNMTPCIATHHSASDLPCPDDKDDELTIPRPSYLPHHISQIQQILINFVPPELAEIIIDLAELWPYTAISRNTYTPAISALQGPDGNAQWCYLLSPPVPSLVRNEERLPTVVRKVKFHFKSYNSRWGGSENQKGEHLKTWFEASILKANDPEINPYHPTLHPHDWFKALAGDHPKLLNPIPIPDPLEINAPEPQPNPFDDSDRRKRWPLLMDENFPPDATEWHKITWDQESDFVNQLTVGDRIVLMVRALSPGWLKTVFNAKIEIYYSLPFSDDV